MAFGGRSRTGFDLERFVERVRTRRARKVFRWLPARRAAVALVLDPDGCVLLARRAERAGDRWSAHVSLPGGMRHADEQLVVTAERETREEVGLELGTGERVGALDELRAAANASVRPMSISPFVYALGARPALALGPEVTEAFWLPLAAAASGALDDRLPYEVLGVTWRFPCWRFEGHVVWGLTLSILRRALALGA